MCTLSWLAGEASGFTAWFNRDELHTRGIEQMPQVRVSAEGVTWVAPIDPDSGGTWLMVNAHGLMVCLLNDYVTPWTLPIGTQRESRGRLVPMTVALDSAQAAVILVSQQNLAKTPPFELVAGDATGGVARMHWDGASAQCTEGPAVRFPRSSSSYQPDLVIDERRKNYPVLVTEESLEEFHRAHDMERGASSVNMCRPDASTRSICRVKVSETAVNLVYDPQPWPGAPRSENETSEFSVTRIKPLEQRSVGIVT